MIIRLTSVDSQNQLRDFSFQVERLEQGFDILNQLAANKEKLIAAQLVDKRFVISLPIESLHGGSVHGQMEDLKRKRKSTLENSLLTVTAVQATLLDLANQRLAVCENQIARFEPLVSRIEALLHNSQELNISPEAKQILKKNYENMLDLCRFQLDKAFHTRQHLMRMISRLR